MSDSIHVTNRFSVGAFNFRRAADSPLETVPLYTYESHGKLYDLLVLGSKEYVRVNMGPWSNLVDAWSRAHYAIRAHFKIGEREGS